MTAPEPRDAQPPWPVVGECHWPAPSLVAKGHRCHQCDGGHEHEWIAWSDAPHPASDLTGSSLVGGTSGPGIPVRCRICGGRKCDMPACRLRRHHHEDHEEFLMDESRDAQEFIRDEFIRDRADREQAGRQDAQDGPGVASRGEVAPGATADRSGAQGGDYEEEA